MKIRLYKKIPKEEGGRKSLSGSVSVEAAIVLPLVMISVISILSVIRIISTYSRIQHALNQVATELSQYSYIYAVSGLKQHHDQALDDINRAAEELKSQTAVIETFYRSVESISGNIDAIGKGDENVVESLLNTVSEIENIQDSSAEIAEMVNEKIQDPMQEVQLVGLALSDSLFRKAKTVVFGTVAKGMIRNNLLKELNCDAGQLEKQLWIKGGIEHIDFSGSAFFDDKETIDIIAEYTVKPQFFIIPEIKLRNRVTVLSWTWGVDHGLSINDTGENESVWNLEKGKSSTSQHLARGKKIDRMFAAELKKELGEHAELTPDNFKTIDLIEYAHNGKDGSLVMIFSLNPFMVTYNSKSAVVGAIRKNLNELSTFQRYEVKDYIIDVSLLSGRYKRMAYIVVPENKELPEAYVQAFEECRKTAGRMGIELIQVQRYGEYDRGDEDEQNNEKESS